MNIVPGLIPMETVSLVCMIVRRLLLEMKKNGRKTS